MRQECRCSGHRRNIAVLARRKNRAFLNGPQKAKNTNAKGPAEAEPFCKSFKRKRGYLFARGLLRPHY